MKKIIVVLLAISMLFMGVASAQEADNATPTLFEDDATPTLFEDDANTALFNELKDSVPVYNDNVGLLPDLIKGRIVDEKIHGIINMDDGSVLDITAVTDGAAKVTEFEMGTPEEPTLVVTTDEATARSYLDSENPIELLLESYADGSVELESTSTVDNIIFSIGKIIVGFL